MSADVTVLAAKAFQCVQRASELLLRPTPAALDDATGELRGAADLLRSLQACAAPEARPELDRIEQALTRVRSLLLQALDYRLRCASIAGVLGYTPTGVLAVAAHSRMRMEG